MVCPQSVHCGILLLPQPQKLPPPGHHHDFWVRTNCSSGDHVTRPGGSCSHVPAQSGRIVVHRRFQYCCPWVIRSRTVNPRRLVFQCILAQRALSRRAELNHQLTTVFGVTAQVIISQPLGMGIAEGVPLSKSSIRLAPESGATIV